MRMRNPKDKMEVINNCTFFYTEEGFSNSNLIHMEIGMGKGKFLLEMALKYPNINFIGVEKYSSVASLAIKKIAPYNLPNLKILIMDAKNLGELLDHKISCIYLNFSDPWPKKRHAKRRLTSEDYLKCYENLFVKDALIYQKTDNDDLFAFSLDSLKNYGYTITDVSYDLHQENKENVMTEYEEKFHDQGIKIKYLKATKANKIKKIIFDVDDTLIMFDKEKYLETYNNILEKYQVLNKKGIDLYKAIGEYEKTSPCFNKETMCSFISSYLETDLPLSFIDDLNNLIASNWIYPPSKDLISLLDFLKNNWELDVLTNFFAGTYQKRLTNMGLFSYFHKIVGGDKARKPDAQVFLEFTHDVKAHECLMIGDNLEIDIKPALNLGMKAILFDALDEYPTCKYLKSHSYEELKKIITELFL